MNAFTNTNGTRNVVRQTRETELVPNGMAQASKGYRQVVIAPDGELRPVHSAARRGLLSKQHTKQVVRNGDYVLKCSWFPITWELLQYQSGTFKSLGDGAFKTLTPLLKKLPAQLDDWFAVTEASPSYLPAGCGWDGIHSVSDVRKMDDIRNFFRGLGGVSTPNGQWLDQLVQSAAISPFGQIGMNWSHAKAPPEYMTNTEDKTLGQWDEWVLWLRNGMVELYHVTPTRLSELDETGAVIQLIGEPTDFPENVVRACKISRNVMHNKSGEHFGVSWELYE